MKRGQIAPKSIFTLFTRRTSMIVGLLFTIFFVMSAIFAPWVAPYDPLKQNLREVLKPPSREFPLGTDGYGRDLLSRIIYGGRISLQVGLISVGIAGSLGVTMGVLAGFYGGWVDNLISRFLDLLISFPGILLALSIMAVLGPSLFNAMIAIGLSATPHYARVSRGVTLGVRELERIEAARSVGAADLRIIVCHVVPDIIPYVVVMGTLGVASAILTASGLSYLGLGAQPPTPEWGAILASGRAYMRDAWWLTTFPGVAIMFVVLGVNLFGDGLRDILDPKLSTD